MKHKTFLGLVVLFVLFWIFGIGIGLFSYVSVSLPFLFKGYYEELRLFVGAWIGIGLAGLILLYFIFKNLEQKEELEKDKYFYENLFESYQFPLIVIDKEGNIISANDPASRLYGYTKEELLNMQLYELENIPKEESLRLISNIFQGLINSFESIHVTKDKRNVNVEIYTNKTTLEGQDYCLLTMIDISEKVILARIFDMLREINRMIISVDLESELLKKTVDTIHMFDFDCVVLLKPKDQEFEIILKKGIVPEAFSYSLEKELMASKSSMTESEGYVSKISVPIFSMLEEGITDDILYIISIYKKEPRFFEDYRVFSVFEEFGKDLSFALRKISQEQNSLILRKALESSKDWVLITDEDGYILYANQTVCKISLYSCEEVIGRKPSIFKSGYHDDDFYKRLWQTIKSGNIFESIFYNKKKNGEIFILEESIIPVTLKDGTIRYITIAKDITQEVELQERLERFRLIDDLTGLLNMAGFSKAVNDRISYLKSSKTSDKGAVLLIDIYGFSELNQIHGFSNMDKLLKDFANMLNSVSKSQFGEDAVLSRVGPDKFGMFVECSQEDITSKINDFINKINELLVSKELGIDIFINIGVSFYDKDGDSFEVLREKANIALQEAKKEGPGTYRFYNEDISSSLKKYKEAQELLERALDKRLFKFFYQPYFDIKTKDFVGFEALIRIIDEDGSVISPYKFIDYLESSSYFLNRFQEVFLKMVEKDMNTFISKAKSHFSSAFNISANSFKDDIFMSKLMDLCHKFEDKLVIEITERMLLSDFEKAKEILRNIRSVGSKIALDDFGTYYSSLSYVKNVELDIIKIDISFVKDIVFDKRSLAVVKVIVNLAKELNIKTVAEGVENEEQYELLKEIGCDIAQGYLFAKPMPLEEAIKYIT